MIRYVFIIEMLITKISIKYVFSSSFVHNKISHLFKKGEYLIYFRKKNHNFYSYAWSRCHSVNTNVFKCIIMFVYPSYTSSSNSQRRQILNLPRSDQNSYLTRNIMEMLTALCIYFICLYKSLHVYMYYTILAILNLFSIWAS